MLLVLKLKVLFPLRTVKVPKILHQMDQNESASYAAAPYRALTQSHRTESVAIITKGVRRTSIVDFIEVYTQVMRVCARREQNKMNNHTWVLKRATVNRLRTGDRDGRSSVENKSADGRSFGFFCLWCSLCSHIHLFCGTFSWRCVHVYVEAIHSHVHYCRLLCVCARSCLCASIG